MTVAFIFDFDGTLVDSKQSIYQCFQNITNRLAPERIDYAKNILIGPPLRDTAAEILGPEHKNLLDEFVKLFIKMHDEQVIKHTKPYPDVENILQDLFNLSIPMAIATNKRLLPTQLLLDHFNWNKFFKTLKCSDITNPSQNKSSMIKQILKNKKFKDSFFVGDTIQDYLAAKENNLRFICADYGYGNFINKKEFNVHCYIKKFSNLKQLIKNWE